MVVLALALLLALPFSIHTVFAQPRYAFPIVVTNTSFLNVRTGPGVQYTVLVTVVGGSELPVLGAGSDGVWYLVSTPVGVGWVNIEYTLPRGDFSVVPTINVNAVTAQLVAPLQVPTLSIAAGQGGGSIAAAATTQTVERFRAQLVVDFVNLRLEPLDNSGPISILRVDPTGVEDYSIVGRSVDARNVQWLQIVVPDAGTGWIEAPKAELRLSARYADVLEVINDIIGLSADPQTGISGALPVLLRGDEVFLIGASANNQFYRVETRDGVIGWLPASSVQMRSGTRSDLIVARDGRAPAATITDGQGGGETVPRIALPQAVVNTGFLNIRSGPGAQFTTVATVAGGTSLDVIGHAADDVWLLVRGSFGIGWLNADFVLFRGNYASVPEISADAGLVTGIAGVVERPVATFSAGLTLYAAPGVNFGAVGFVNGPGELPIVARTGNGEWIQLDTPVGFGWVLASQVLILGDQSLIPVLN
jgi:uncharacterized protein YgiM (DUF1202 family)